MSLWNRETYIVERETTQYKQGIHRNRTSEEQRRICAMQLYKTKKMPLSLLCSHEQPSYSSQKVIPAFQSS